MHLFFVPNIEDNEVVLDETESKHAVRVLRLSTGDQINLIDGKGGFFTAEINEPHPKRCRLRITDKQTEYGKRNFRLHIAIAPTKNIDRMEWFLEKCTEIGIDEITPLLSEHSERKSIKPERLEKIIISAMKQSLKAYLPKLNTMIPFDEFIAQSHETQKFIAHCYPGKKEHLKNLVSPGKDILILIGPEGDFSREEVARAQENGFDEISLGTARLRTETAGIVACHIVNLLNDQ